MMQTCPKCGKPYLKYGFFGGPDETNICAMTVHTEKIVKGLFGVSIRPDEKCFLTLDEFNTFFGDPILRCEDCVGACNKGWCDYCRTFNNRPNFKEKGEEDQWYI